MQPTYLPWLGYFDLIDQVELVVFLDQVEFSRQSWQQRNRIKTPKGLDWLTVPVLRKGKTHQLICEVEINGLLSFAKTHLQSIRCNYARAQHFPANFPGLASILLREPSWQRLADLNIELIQWLCGVLGIQTPIHRASCLGVNGKRTYLLAAICEKLGAQEYLSALGSAEYLLDELGILRSRGIEVWFHHYTHPTYQQRFPPFVPYASTVDLLFHEGPRSLDIIRSGRGLPFSPEECQGMVSDGQLALRSEPAEGLIG
jgi:hypothetical protein